MGQGILPLLVVIFALLALGASIIIPYWILQSATGDLAGLRVPLLALAGFLGVFAAVALLVLSFKAMGLTDEKQALGMPEGSVRALIAIFLIVTLGMAALFLLGPARAGQLPQSGAEENNKDKGAASSGGAATGTEAPKGTEEPKGSEVPGGTDVTSTSTTSTDIPRVELAVLRTASAQGGAPSVNSGKPTRSRQDAKDQKKDGKAPTKTNSGTGTNNTNGEGEKGAAAGGNQDGGDLAKQFLTLVGGLVTTVVGFYFGSQTANSAAAKGARAATDAATAAATHATTETIRALRG
jgi:hypothetical protein